MRMTQVEIQDMLNAYPELIHQRMQQEDIFQGSIEIYHNEINSNTILTGKFGMKIVIGDEYPQKVPVVYDVNNLRKINRHSPYLSITLPK